MIDISKLEGLQLVMLDRVADALRTRDVGAVARWSSIAEECEQLIKEARTLEEKSNSLMRLFYSHSGEKVDDEPVTYVEGGMDETILQR